MINDLEEDIKQQKRKELETLKEWYERRQMFIPLLIDEQEEEEEFFGICDATKEHQECCSVVEINNEGEYIADWNVAIFLKEALINQRWEIAADYFELDVYELLKYLVRVRQC